MRTLLKSVEREGGSTPHFIQHLHRIGERVCETLVELREKVAGMRQHDTSMIGFNALCSQVLILSLNKLESLLGELKAHTQHHFDASCLEKIFLLKTNAGERTQAMLFGNRLVAAVEDTISRFLDLDGTLGKGSIFGDGCLLDGPQRRSCGCVAKEQGAIALFIKPRDFKTALRADALEALENSSLAHWKISIADAMKLRRFAIRDTLCTAGNEARYAWLIVSGTVKISASAEDAKPSATFARMGGGDLIDEATTPIGYRTMYDTEPCHGCNQVSFVYCSTVTAASACVAYEIDRSLPFFTSEHQMQQIEVMQLLQIKFSICVYVH